MKTSFVLAILLSSLLIFNVAANAPLAFAAKTKISSRPQSVTSNSTDTADKPTTNVIVDSDTPQFASDIDVAGSAGSGWKLDVNVGRAPGYADEINPSIATYINQTTGEVTLWVAMQGWSSYHSHWYLWVWRSDDGGATWQQRGASTWTSNRSMINPSIAVSPYNGTVFVAVQDAAFETLSNDISIHVISPEASGSWSYHTIDTDTEDDRSPKLVSEYSWGSTNMLFVSYEKYWTYDDRDLHFGYSTDWGKTWTTRALQGGSGPGLEDVFTQSDITYSQRNLYIAYRHSTDYLTPGHIDVMYSTNYGVSFLGPFEVSGHDKIEAWEPSVIGSRVGGVHQPTTLWVAYRNASGSETPGTILASWSHNYGDTWSSPQIIAASNSKKPELSVDGMGTENTNLQGRFHLVYWKSETSGSRINGIYYTQIADFEPHYYSAPSVYWFDEGWSTPQGQIIDNDAWASMTHYIPTITTFTRKIGVQTIWVPGVAWTDLRNPSYMDDVYFTTLDTMFTVSYYPSTQSVVAGGSLSFLVTVTLNSGATAPATLDITGAITYHTGSAHIWGHTFSPPTLTPTATSLLTFNTANYIGPGSYSFNVSAVIGGYRRFATITFTVVAAPTLTLNLSPSTVARGQKLTISGQLTPGMATSINIYYRFPHATGSWALATALPTNAAGAYSVSATVPMSLTPGVYDLIAVWFNSANGKYAASPIRVATFT